MLNRRGLITGLASLIVAPAIVRATSIMPVYTWKEVSINVATYPYWVRPYRLDDPLNCICGPNAYLRYLINNERLEDLTEYK